MTRRALLRYNAYVRVHVVGHVYSLVHATHTMCNVTTLKGGNKQTRKEPYIASLPASDMPISQFGCISTNSQRGVNYVPYRREEEERHSLSHSTSQLVFRHKPWQHKEKRLCLTSAYIIEFLEPVGVLYGTVCANLFFSGSRLFHQHQDKKKRFDWIAGPFL